MSNITNLNRDYLIKINVKEATIDAPKMTFWNTDKKTSNMFIQLVINMSENELIKNYVTIENATDYKITLNVIKPKTNQYRTFEAKLLNEEKALFEIDLTSEFIDQVGNYNFEFEVSSKVDSNDESITTSSSAYEVKGSILTNLNQEISSSPDLPILKQLIEQVKQLQGGDLTDYQKKSDAVQKTTVEDGKLYLTKSDGTKLDDGTALPTGSGTSIDDSNTVTDKTWSSSKIDSQFKDIANEIGKNEDGSDIELPTTDKTIKGAITELFQNVSNGKTLVANAITDKGVNTLATDTFQTMATNISNITGGSKQKDAYRENRVLIWEDDFDGAELDTSKWSIYVREKLNHAAYTTDEPDNVYVENSNLVLQAIKRNYNGSTQPWTSGFVRTNNLAEFKYGRIEAKIKMPKVPGTWPAFWTMGANHDDDFTNGNPTFEGANNLGEKWPQCGELDILEQYGTSDYVETAMWYNASSDKDNQNATRFGTGKISNIDINEYHIYGIEWTEEKIDVFVDDKIFKTYTNYPDAFKQAHYLMLNLAIGGTAGATSDDTNYCKMYIDWVRVYAPYISDEIALNRVSISMTSTSNPLQIKPVFKNNPYDKTLKWESSNVGVAKVYGGYVYPVADGECDITCTTKQGNTAICHVSIGAIINTYTITNNLIECTNSNALIEINENSSYTATLNANSGYIISSVTITMGDVDITNTAYSNGTISIPQVTGNVVITATSIIDTPDNIVDGAYIVLDARDGNNSTNEWTPRVGEKTITLYNFNNGFSENTLVFDGVDDYITFDEMFSDLSITNGYTYSAYCKVNDLTKTNVILTQDGNGGIILLALRPQENIIRVLRPRGGTLNATYTFDTDYHMYTVRCNTDSTIDLFVDNDKIASQSINMITESVKTKSVMVGATVQYNAYSNINLRSLYIYPKRLSDLEISKNVAYEQNVINN